MPIVDTDIVFRLSIPGAAAGDADAQPDPNDSLGEFMSTTALDLGTPLNNLFDDVSGAENAASDVEYRCIFVLNDHASLTLQSAKVWLQSEVAGGASIAIGLDPAGNVARNSGTDQAATVATEQDAPAGVSFSSPASEGAALSIGDLDADDVRAIWIRRTAANTAALNNDGVTLRVKGDTAA
jgi:hypothetical protein